MKKVITLIAIVGTLAAASCTKHACPAYGSTGKAATPPPVSERG